jgi:RNA polymerase sigma factor (sigma-70 family)
LVTEACPFQYQNPICKLLPLRRMPEISYSKKEQDFKQLYLSTRDGLFSYLNLYTRDIHLVEDIMQQCYLNIWERMDRILNPLQAGGLVRVYARNLLIDVIRKRMKEDILWLEQLQQEAARVVDQSMNAAGREQLVLLDAAVEKLPEPARKVYLLHRENGLSYRQIAAELSISVSLVEKRMSNAIRLLKNELLTDLPLVLLMVSGNELLKL